MPPDAPLCARPFWPHQIVQCFRPLLEPSGPALEHLCQAVGLNAELRKLGLQRLSEHGRERVRYSAASDMTGDGTRAPPGQPSMNCFSQARSGTSCTARSAKG